MRPVPLPVSRPSRRWPAAARRGVRRPLSQHVKGAYTGEVSAAMVREFGCTYVIVGHSERRSLFGEGDEVVAAKFGAAMEAGLVPILCVGETLAQREAGVTESVVAGQLDAVVDRFGVAVLDRAVVAYEPVWAIGTGRTATPGAGAGSARVSARPDRREDAAAGAAGPRSSTGAASRRPTLQSCSQWPISTGA